MHPFTMLEVPETFRMVVNGPGSSAHPSLPTGGVGAQGAHSTHSAHFTGTNWDILGQLAILLPKTVNSRCIARFESLAIQAVLHDALVDVRLLQSTRPRVLKLKVAWLATALMVRAK